MEQTTENALIGDLIEDPRIISNVRRFVYSGEMFANKQAGKMYDIFLTLQDEVGGFDLPVISDKVVKAGIAPSEIALYVVQASPGAAEWHAKVVAEQHLRRETCALLTANRERITRTDDDIADIMADVQVSLSVLREIFEQEKTVHISDVVHEACDELDDILAGKRQMGLPFGFADIDKVTGGMDNGDLVVIAAPEKSGKSTMMIQTIFHNAQRGTPCLIFSSEMMRKQILYRKALMDTKIRWIDVKRNMINEREKVLLYKRLHELAGLPVYIRHGVFSVIDITAEVERYIRDKHIGLVAVDYIQRVVPVSKKANENREREVAAVSSGLKNVAIEYGIPVLALSQVNDDLRARESRAIEQDMDKMITIDNRPEQPEGMTGVDVPIRLRQRMGLSGNMGDLKLHYDLINGIWYSGFNGDEQAARAVEALEKQGLF